MMSDGGDVSPLSDISANMFAAFILILIMAAAISAERRPAPTPIAPRVISDADLHFVSRRALDAPAMVRMLYDRGADAPGASVDISNARALIVRAGQAPIGFDAAGAAAGVGAALRGSPGPVRLYVFANDLYGPVARALLADDLAYEELSAPAALRSAEGQDWSPGFVALTRKAGDFADFKQGLAALLNGGESGAATRGASGNGAVGGGGAGASLADLLGRLKRIWSAFLALLALATAIGSIAWIETRTRRGAIR